jgi:hypothetical protein
MSNSNQIIWTFRVTFSTRRTKWARAIEISSDASFLELHEAIQAAVDFDNDHLFEFFIGRASGSRLYGIGGEPNWDTFNPIKKYRKIRLKDIWPLPTGRRLFYLFDFGDNWLFQIMKTRHKDKAPLPGVVYPRVIEKLGINPEQYPQWD